jgi:BirA family biotin operon repressor/biotin-[acetyl-CoA-carboxylase] ligase
MQINFKITHLESVDSTSNYVATAFAQGKIGHGSVILADNQTSGRGQRDATWQSEGSLNLLFSFLVIPDNMSASEGQSLMHCTTLALVELLQSFDVKAQVKWPNDIYVGMKKIAGILIENQLAGSRISRSIIGVGLNINQADFGELNATSLYLETGKYVDLKEVLLRFLYQFNEHWMLLCANHASQLKSKYCSMLLGLNETRTFEDASGEFSGVISGVDDLGRLQVETEQGPNVYDLKEIRFML